MLGTGALVARPRSAPSRKGLPNWAKVSFLLTMIIAAGGGIYVFKSQLSTGEDRSSGRPVANDLTNVEVAETLATTTTESQVAGLLQARLFVKPGDATSRYQAILAARKIPATTPAAANEIRQSIELWSQEIQQIAQGYAKQQHWRLAIDTAKMVPIDATNYLSVQAQMAEWRSKL
jgi:hypothetical protein